MSGGLRSLVARLPKSNLLAISCLCLAFVAIFYQMATYSGPYRWLSELQLSVLGIYLPVVSMLPTVPLFILAQLFEVPPKGIDQAYLDSFDTFEARAYVESSKALQKLRPWLILSFGACLASIAYAFIWVKPAQAVPVRFDATVAQGGTVPNGLVDLKIAVPEALLSGSVTLSNNKGRNETFVAAGTPDTHGAYRIVVATKDLFAEGPDSYSALRSDGHAIGVLSKGVDAEARAGFEKIGLPVSDDAYTFEPGRPEEDNPGVIFGGLFGLVFVTVGLVALVQFKKLQKAKRDMEA